MASARKLPNILIVGTPGTGKTTTAQMVVASAPSMRHVEVGTLVKNKQLHDGWDDEYECYILDEDRICDELEETMEGGGVIVDFHGADLFPERWFDLVVVLRTDNSILYPRLQSRHTQTHSSLAASPSQTMDRVQPLSHGSPIPHPSRGYSEKKLTENMEAEIMQVILDEVRESYKEEIVVELSSDSLEALESNVARIVQYIADFSAKASCH